MVAIDYVKKVKDHQNSLLWEQSADEVLALAGDIRDKKVLDYGCGTGRLSRMLSWRGAAVTGADIDPAMIEICRQHGNGIRFTTLDDLGWHPNQFHVTIACNVLGHVSDLRNTLHELVHMTKFGGRIIVLNPNIWNTLFRLPSNMVKGYRSDPTIKHRFSLAHLDYWMAMEGCGAVSSKPLGETYLGTHSLFLAEYRKNFSSI